MGRKGEREGEKHQCVVDSNMPPTGDLDHNPGMCPDWDSHQQPFGLQAGAQSTGPHQPGLISLFLRGEVIVYSLKVNLKHYHNVINFTYI